jgi:hypothetical protein
MPFYKKEKRQTVTASLTLQAHEEQEHHFNMILNRHYPTVHNWFSFL